MTLKDWWRRNRDVIEGVAAAMLIAAGFLAQSIPTVGIFGW